MGREGYDLRNLAFELSSKISNSNLFNLAANPYTTNSTSYTRVGGGIVCMECFRKSKLVQILFFAAAGALGGDGLDVQLYDATNATEIGVVKFLGTEDFTVKSIDVLSYFISISGAIEVEVNIRKAGPIGPSTFNTASMRFEGII